MDVILCGGLVNLLRSLASATPTLLIGLFIQRFSSITWDGQHTSVVWRRLSEIVAAIVAVRNAAARLLDWRNPYSSRDATHQDASGRDYCVCFIGAAL